MATSGTVAQTPITVDTFITQALQRAGKLPSTAGGELLARIREALYFLLADLGNDGINLWCKVKSVISVEPYATSYQMVKGTKDITDMLYRELFDLGGILTNPDPTQLQFTSTNGVVPVYNISAEFQAPGRATLAVDYSLDGITWTNLVVLNPVDVVAGSEFSLDLDNSAIAAYWRIREVTNPSLLAMQEVRFRKVNNELTLYKLNQTDYVNLPNKQSTGQKPLQFWFDKQIDPRVWVWPIPTQDRGQLVIWSALQPQDPGSMTNELAVPTHWYRYIATALAVEAAMLMPPNELPPGRLEQLQGQAAEQKIRASNGESDGSSYQLAPNISPYTR